MGYNRIQYNGNKYSMLETLPTRREGQIRLYHIVRLLTHSGEVSSLKSGAPDSTKSSMGGKGGPGQ